MIIKVKMFNANYETYKKFYEDAVVKAYRKHGINVEKSDINLEIEKLPGDTVQSQRSCEQHCRAISVYENDSLKFIIGFTNTNYDDDKLKEVEIKGGKYVYGSSNYHSNTYFFQGINKIFEYFFDQKEIYKDVQLYFYLLDTDQSYAKNLSNLMNYRKLATIGFDILNIDLILFDEYKPLGFSLDENIKDIKYISFNKFANDLLYLSRKNIGNVPSYLKCIDESFDIEQSDEDDEDTDNSLSKTIKYIYTFKTLSAEGYDSLITMWTLSVLAKKENKNLEFLFASERYNLKAIIEEQKLSTGFTGPILRVIDKFNLDIKYETASEILSQSERENSQYETAKSKGILRNQELFKNNMREKGIQTKCYLCGCEIESILEASHIWGVAEIKKTSNKEINSIVSQDCFNVLLDSDNKHYEDSFYKKYMLANSGDNGIWLCSNHHGLFDSNYFCFDSADGKVLVKLSYKDEEKLFFGLITPNNKIPSEIITPITKVFLEKRKNVFEKENESIKYDVNEFTE